MSISIQKTIGALAFTICLWVSAIAFKSYELSPAVAYIDQYRDLAIVEMHRSGIPASIIMAQGLLESNNGFSELATNANNHFGIKCKSYWRGSTYFHEDDDYDHKGNLTESCFRAYNSSIDSYVDHSNFLMQSDRYAVLFTYTKTDYLQWAHGLRSCGYATDKKYAYKLINKIEQHQLYLLDNAPNPAVRIN